MPNANFKIRQQFATYSFNSLSVSAAAQTIIISVTVIIMYVIAFYLFIHTYVY